MDDSSIDKIFKAVLTEHEFNRLSNFIYTEYGIKMPPAKKVMLQSRLQKRLRVLNMTSYKEYVDLVFSKDGADEVVHMIDVVSTNKTDFFREATHFDFLSQVVLPAFVSTQATRRTIKVWSSACSSGEEAYSLAMVMSEFATQNSLLDFSIYATDISTRILQHAALAVYHENRISTLPMNLKKRYFLKSKDRSKQTVRVIPQLRQKVNFQRFNLMNTTYNTPDVYDVIFCRNVLIYFDRETQERVISRLCTRLKQGGYFFLGHSESILNLKVPLKQVKPTIFIRI